MKRQSGLHSGKEGCSPFFQDKKIKGFTAKIGVIAVVLAVAFAGLAGAGAIGGRLKERQEEAGQQAESVYTKNLFAMDTYFSLKAYGENAETALSMCEERVRELEALLSVTAEGSDVWRINHAQAGDGAQMDNAAQAGDSAQVDDSAQTGNDAWADDGTQTVNEIQVQADTYRLISEALEIGRQTEGALDITLYPVLREWGFTTGEYQIPGRERLQELLSRVDYRAVSLEERTKPERSGESEETTELTESGESMQKKYMGTDADVFAYYVKVPVGMEMDLGAVAKGYTGDALIDILRQQGVNSAILDLGGNVQTLGFKPDGSPWKVAVRNPFNKEALLGVLNINDKCVITSGGYERYFTGADGEIYWHILDPADGEPAWNGLVSVTVVGDRGVRCDALSTALFVMGEEKAEHFWRQQGDFEMLLVTEDGRLILTEGLRECFDEETDWAGRITFIQHYH